MTDSADAPLFRFDVIGCDDLPAWRDGLERIWTRTIDGLVIKDVLSEATRAAVLERLRRGDPALRSQVFPHRRDADDPPYVISRGIITAPPDLGSYFDDAAHFRTGCRALFAGHQDFETRIEAVFRSLAAGLPVEVATGPAGQTYTPATIRVLPAGDGISIHCGNDFLHMPESWHLRTVVDNETQLSYFVTLQGVAGGGALELYALTWAETGGDKRIDGVPVDLMASLSRTMIVPVEAGDLLIFDGGRIYHRVTPVEPGGRRVTIGGFIGYAQGRQRWYYWS